MMLQEQKQLKSSIKQTGSTNQITIFGNINRTPKKEKLSLHFSQYPSTYGDRLKSLSSKWLPSTRPTVPHLTPFQATVIISTTSEE